MTIRQLLSHASGLPGSRKFYQWCAARDELLRGLAATPLEAAAPGTRVTYSDPGYMALGQLVSAVTGEPLDAAVGHLVTGPLGMTMTGYNPAVHDHDFAATEPWLVLLTNSVHFGRAPDHIQALRRDLHAALAPRAARM